MSTDFITALSGVQIAPMLPDVYNVPQEDENVFYLLGLRSASDAVRVQRALHLYRMVQSSPHAALYLSPTDVIQDYTGRLPVVMDPDAEASILQAAKGPGRVLPSAPEALSWPYPDTCTLKRRTQSTAEFACGHYSVVCKYSQFAEADLSVVLPEEFGIKGDIQLNDPAAWERGDLVHLPVRFRYPVNAVVDLLKKDNDTYNLLDRHDFASDFYSADRPEECIALVAVALYRELTHGRF